MLTIMATGELDVFSPDSIAGYLSTAVVTIIGLVITVFILKKLLYKPILGVMNERQNSVQTMLADAERRHAEAVEEQRKLDEAMAQARTEAAELLKQAKIQADRRRDTILSDAKVEAQSILDKAEQDRDLMLHQDKERIYNEAVNLAVAAVGNMAAQRYTGEDEWQGMREALAEFVEEKQKKDEQAKQ